MSGYTGRLRRYEDIASAIEIPRYLATKRRSCDFSDDDSTSNLWKLHDALLGHEKTTTGGRNLLELKALLADKMLSECMICERRCGADRKGGRTGKCGVLDARISSEFIHMGEEPEIIPSYTIFFSGCTFRCVYCQNWDISTRPNAGRSISPDVLVRMIEARDPGMRIDTDESRPIGTFNPFARLGYAKNVNWVGGDPTSNLPFILRTLSECRSGLPQVWNSNMYLTVESMRLLDGVIDLYLTDFKYGNDECAERLSGVTNYFEIITRNHLLAAGQCDMIVRHLVLPNHVECCTRPVLEWIAENVPEAVVNVMAQYRPEHRAFEFEEISRRMSEREFGKAIRIAEQLGLHLTA